MTAQLGERVELHGDTLAAFPAPGRLSTLDGFPGLSDRKVGWLRALAAAALDGQLDAARLRTIAAGWRPYGTWVSLLMRTELEDDTQEIQTRQAASAPARP